MDFGKELWTGRPTNWPTLISLEPNILPGRAQKRTNYPGITLPNLQCMFWSGLAYSSSVVYNGCCCGLSFKHMEWQFCLYSWQSPFWVRQEVRQECTLPPLLFAISACIRCVIKWHWGETFAIWRQGHVCFCMVVNKQARQIQMSHFAGHFWFSLSHFVINLVIGLHLGATAVFLCFDRSTKVIWATWVSLVIKKPTAGQDIQVGLQSARDFPRMSSKKVLGLFWLFGPIHTSH